LARSSRHALKHGLRARRHVLLADEDSAEYRAFQAAAQVELAPVGALQTELATRIVTTAWRARRADRLEAAMLGRFLGAAAEHAGAAQEALCLELIRDGYGPRALPRLGAGRALPRARRAGGAPGPGPCHPARSAGASRTGGRERPNEPEKLRRNRDLTFVAFPVSFHLS